MRSGIWPDSANGNNQVDSRIAQGIDYFDETFIRCLFTGEYVYRLDAGQNIALNVAVKPDKTVSFIILVGSNTAGRNGFFNYFSS